ncbi:MAG TPA: hypothetical protein VLJ59_05845 [Mycobacteriales bacterium]|nr:hypothetical protein [Mycobacteriales bacterium]
MWEHPGNLTERERRVGQRTVDYPAEAGTRVYHLSLEVTTGTVDEDPPMLAVMASDGGLRREPGDGSSAMRRDG